MKQLDKIYAIRFADGTWAQNGGGWKSTRDIAGAKLYGKIGAVKQAISYQTGNGSGYRKELWDKAEVVQIETYVADESHRNIEDLKNFYGVETLVELIETQARQIDRLQAKLRKFFPLEPELQIVRA